jgi:hypothetical protein
MDNTSNKNDEIDLRLIFSMIGKLFSGLWNFIISFITNCILILKRRWGLIFIFCSLGIGLGVGLFYYLRPIYSSTLVLSSNTLTNDFCADEIENLNLIIDDKTPELLAEHLQISLSAAKAMKELEFDNYNEKLKKKYDNRDTVVLGLPFKIKAYAYRNTLFDTLQKALVNHLENNEYSLKRKAIKIRNINSLKEKLTSDIKDLDSLKFSIAANMTPRGTENGFVFGQPLDPLNTFREGITLYKEDLDLNTSLELIDNIQVIQDFVPRAKPDSPRMVRNIAIYGSGGFLLGLMLAFYLERKKILVRA